LTGIVNYTELNTAAPVAVAIDKTDYRWLRPAVKLAIIMGWHVRDPGDAAGAEPRVLFHVARRPAAQAVLRCPSEVPDPWRSNIGLCSRPGCSRVRADPILGEATSIGTLFAFVLVCGGIISCAGPIRISRTLQDAVRSCRPDFGIGFNLFLIYGLGWTNWARLFGWMAIGLIVYFTYSRKAQHHA
jgi:APA family basic amino acid/polyamine antiporter